MTDNIYRSKISKKYKQGMSSFLGVPEEDLRNLMDIADRYSKNYERYNNNKDKILSENIMDNLIISLNYAKHIRRGIENNDTQKTIKYLFELQKKLKKIQNELKIIQNIYVKGGD